MMRMEFAVVKNLISWNVEFQTGREGSQGSGTYAAELQLSN